MRRFTMASAMVAVAACCALFTPLATAGPAESDPAPTEMPNLGLRGVYFVENQCQWSDAEVYYGLRSRGLDVAFRESSFTMHLSRERSELDSEPGCVPLTRAVMSEAMSPARHSSDRVRSGSLEEVQYEHLTLTVSFPGSNPVRPRGVQPQAATFNYFVGGEGRGTAGNVPSFGAVVYADLYDGIDLLVCGNDDGVLKYEFHVAPGADYTQIRIEYDGIDSLRIDETGDLHIATTFGTLADGAPVAWQDIEGERRPLAARFEMLDYRTYRIAVDGPVDPTRELIIDPYVEWMTYLGGISDDEGWGIAVDSAGDALVAGRTSSTDFEGRNNAIHGDSDAFVVKVSASGALQWMTYLGGYQMESGYDIVLDSAGDALVSGYTGSSNFEGRKNAFHGVAWWDGFVLKISASGDLQWMIYLGGSSQEYCFDIALDSAGDVLVTGETRSTDFEGRNNARYGYDDAFVVKVSVADDPQLVVNATCPSGGPFQIEWSGATPGGQVALVFARDTGRFIIPDGFPCEGRRLGLGPIAIQIGWRGDAGADGSGTINGSAGSNACGGYLQLLDLTTCATSNAARIE